MTVTVYRSTDSGAPQVRNTAGNLTTLFDALLVNGYTGHASQGWSIAVTDTNKRVYRMPAGTSQMYLRIDDTGTTSARARGWEVKADINDAVDANNRGPYPTDTQASGGLYIYKASAAADRAWIAIGNGKMLYFFIEYSGVTNDKHGSAFGDFTSYKPGDAFNNIIVGSTGSAYPYLGQKAGPVTGHFMPRTVMQTGTSALVYTNGSPNPAVNTTYVGYTGMTYPAPTNGYLWINPIYIADAVGGLRGEFPGLWEPEHARTILTDKDTFSGVGELAGKTFEWVRCQNVSGTGYCAMAIETSNTW